MDHLSVIDKAGILHVAGELDLESGPVLMEAMTQGGDDAGRVVHVDLSEVTFVDSSGLRFLLQAGHDGMVIAVDGVSPQVRRFFELAGVADLFGLS